MNFMRLGYINPLESYRVGENYLSRDCYCRNDKWANTIRDMIAYVQKNKIFSIVVGSNGTILKFIVGKNTEFRFETYYNGPNAVYEWVISDLKGDRPEKRIGTLILRSEQVLYNLTFKDLSFFKDWLTDRAKPTDTFDWE